MGLVPTPTLEPTPPLLRRTRIVCISDTHNTHLQLPRGDILIHAGDLTNQGTYGELQKTLAWLSLASGFKLKIIVAGNHDITLDAPFYRQYGSYFHNQQMQDSAACIELIAKTSGIVYLRHGARTFELKNEDGTTTRFKVFGSPYSPSRGLWAFGYAPEDAATKWADIPLDTDIVITHTPPKFHCDESATRGAAGCEDLRRALWRVRPRLAVCGHVHEGRGVESVLWDLEAPNVRFKEVETFYWEDATVGSKRQFRVDLTTKSVSPLRNDGGKGRLGSTVAMMQARGREVSPEEQEAEYGTRVVGAVGQAQQDGPSPEEEQEPRNPKPPFPQSGLAERPIPPLPLPRPIHPSTYGIGGLPATGRCDFEALAGREGRRETCIINAAIAGSSWPHPAGKKFNKPIVIDIELPVVDAKGED